jgi:DNA-binding XRE family transcriptional regulator
MRDPIVGRELTLQQRLGLLLHKVRVHAHFTQADMAAYLNCSERTVRRMESGCFQTTRHVDAWMRTCKCELSLVVQPINAT